MPPLVMPIITAKYAPPSIMPRANARVTAESHHVPGGSNSFAVPSSLEMDLLSSRRSCTWHSVGREGTCAHTTIVGQLRKSVSGTMEEHLVELGRGLIPSY